ncbi:MAG TPA: hypothetical protein V6C81_31255 [Planktothrix sp.]
MTDGRLSRRFFLLSSLASAAGSYWSAPVAWASKHAPLASGPRPLARQDWAPAIVPDHIGVDRGYCIFTDEFGRLAVVDMRKPDNPKSPPHVVGELSGLGKKVVDFKVVPGRGYGVVAKSNDSQDAELALICVQLTAPADPAVVGQTALDKFSEVSSLTVAGDTVCVGGTSFSGDNFVAIYGVPKKGRQVEPVMYSSWTAETPIVAIDLQDRVLAVLEQSKLTLVNLLDPRSPQVKQSINLDGDCKALARFKDTALVVGTAGGGACMAKTVALGGQPHVISDIPLDPIATVLDAAALKDRFVVLGEGSSDRYVASLPFDKTHRIIGQQISPLPKEKSGGFGLKSSIVLSGKFAYVASGWTGVQILSYNGSDWDPVFKYTIPRLPASSIATWGDRVVLAGSDLKLYDIAQPERPSLVTTATLTSAVRSIVGAGSYVICLAHDAISLRKMDSLETVVASSPVVGQELCFDTIDQKAYVVHDDPKKTVLTRFKVYSNDIAKEQTFELPGSFSRVSAHAGSIAASGINDITLFALTQSADAVGTRHFENLGIRDVCLLDDFIVATAVDQRSKGFLLILSKDQKDLRVLGSLDLPHDGVALAAQKTRVVTVGKSAEGNDVVTIVDITAPALPKILVTMPAVEAASTVAIKDKLAIVGGRGIEILSLT